MKNKISKKSTFAEIMQKHPELGKVLLKKGMHCVGCPMAMQETLEEGAIMHDIDPDKLAAELNKKLEEKNKKK